MSTLSVHNDPYTFLESWLHEAPDGSLVEVRAINSKGHVAQQWFAADDEGIAAAVQWATPFDGNRNVYYGVCPRFQRGGQGNSVRHAGGLWVDDPRQPLPAGFPTPSIIVASSTAKLQLLWRLDAWTDDLDRVELLNTGLRNLVGGDAVQDRPRVLRLPGFTNIKPEHTDRPRAKLLECDPFRAYSLDDIEAALPTLPKAKADGAKLTPDEASELWTRTIHQDHRRATDGLPQNVGYLRGHGVPVDAAVAIMLAWSREHCDPALPDEVVEQHVRGMYQRYGIRERQAPPPRPWRDRQGHIHNVTVEVSV